MWEEKKFWIKKSSFRASKNVWKKWVFFLAYLHEGDWTAVADVLAQIKDWIYVI